MKVLIISHMYPSIFDEVRGIFVHQQVKELKKQSCEVKVISPIPWTPFPIKYLSKKWKKYSEIPQKAIWEGIEVYCPRYLTFPKALFFSFSGEQIYRGIKKTVDKIYKDFNFDLIHTHTVLPDGYAGMKITKLYKKPLIITIHGSDLLIYPYRNKKIFINTKQVLEKASEIITVNNNLKNKCVEEYAISEKKTEVIYNGYDQTKFNLSKKPQRENSKEYSRILFVGHMIKGKGIFDLLRAMLIIREQRPQLFKKISWIFIGKGNKLEKFRNDLKVHKLDNTVEIVGQILHKRMLEFMKKADLMVLPSWSEGLPTVLLEAMACGLPVVATNVGGIPEIINKDTGILIEPQKPKDLAEAIMYTISKKWDSKLINEHVKKYTWAENAQKNIEIYEKILRYEK